MKLIVGLGNPGKEYDKTRHNVGFMILDQFLGTNNKWSKKFDGLYQETVLEGEKVIFLKPETFMNNSGFSVSKFVNFFHIEIADILIIQDDIDLSLGTYRLKRNSSSGGHNGIKSIISALNTDAFLRLKVGVTENRDTDTISFVLGKFGKHEMELLLSNFSTYEKIIKSFVTSGVEKTFLMYSKK